MKILISEPAFQDLQDIYDYIAENDCIDSADYVKHNIRATIESLSLFPERGNYVKELLNFSIKSYRELFFKPYRIIYGINSGNIVVHLVADGRRDFASLLIKRLTTK